MNKNFKNNNLKSPQKNVVPIRIQLRKFSFILLTLGLFYLIGKDVLVGILAPILEFAARVYDFITQFI